VHEFEPFVSADVVAEFIKLTRRRVLELSRLGEIPSHPIGDERRTYRYLLSEVSNWLQRRRS
jgi:hypothetical protein